MKIQEALETLKDSVGEGEWSGKPNEWVRQLAGIHLNEVGVRLALKIFGGTIAESRESGFKIQSGNMRIEVKTATMGRNRNSSSLAWRNIEPVAPFTHLALIAVYPSDAKIFFFEKSELPMSSLHEIRNEPGKYQIVVTNIDAPFYQSMWLSRYEYVASP